MDADIPKTSSSKIASKNATFEQRFVDRTSGKLKNKSPIEDRFWGEIKLISNKVLIRANKSGTVSKAELADAITSGSLEGVDAQVAAALYLYFDEIDESDKAIWTKNKIGSKDLNSFFEGLRLAEKSANKFDSLLEWADDKERWKGITGNSKARLSMIDIAKAQKLANLSSEDRANLAELYNNFGTISKNGKLGVHELFEKYDSAWEDLLSRRGRSFRACMADVESNQQSKDAQKLFANEKEPLKSITPNSVKQGYAGDCAVKAALYELAALRPKEILGMIKPKGGMDFDVSFPGKKPVRLRRPSNEELALYNSDQNPNGFWAALISKAYGLYTFDQANPIKKFTLKGFTAEERAANNGRVDEAIRTLTGNKVYQKLVKSLSAEQLQLKLMEGQGSKSIMILGTENSNAVEEDGFKKEHAYSVSRVEKTNGKVNVTLHDPLGASKKRAATRTVPLEAIRKNFNSITIEIQEK